MLPYPPKPQHNGCNDLSNVERMARENRMSNQIAGRHVWTYGSGADNCFPLAPQTSSDDQTQSSGLSAVAELQSKRYRKKLRAKVRVWFNVFGPRVAEFELAIHIRSKAWLSPSLAGTVRCINIRPRDSPIFDACTEGDLDEIRSLIECGAANINDVTEAGIGLLVVSIYLAPANSFIPKAHSIARVRMLMSGSSPVRCYR